MDTHDFRSNGRNNEMEEEIKSFNSTLLVWCIDIIYE